MRTHFISKVLNISLLVAILAAPSVFAAGNLVQLNSKEITIASDSAVVVRTSETPNKVKVKMDLPFGETVCEREATRTVYGQDPSCGYGTSDQSVCHEECRGDGDHDKDDHGHGGGDCHTECHMEPVQYMLSCYYPETYCAEYGVETNTVQKRVTLKFRGLPKLAAGQTEEYELTGHQNRIDGTVGKYDMVAKTPGLNYEIISRNFLGARVIVKKGN